MRNVLERGGHMKTDKVRHFIFSLVMTTCAGLSSVSAHAGSLNLGTSPLFVTTTVPPLTMLVMGRDHKLYYEAYNDASDLNGDGIVDVGYQGYHGNALGPGGQFLNVDYYGYFNSYACYSYDSSTGQFNPKSAKTAAQITAKDKTCPGGAAGDWSGDFLNYVTTARIDAMRKVFYGGSRSTDTNAATILERTHIPQDAHAWGKEYASVARDGYDIAQYTNLSSPAAGTYHLFANVSLANTAPPYGSNTGTPRLRVLNDSKHRVWEWLSKERPVAGRDCIDGLNGPTTRCSTAASNWSIVPSSVFQNLTRVVYKWTSSSFPGHPRNENEFDILEASFAAATPQGTDNPSQINGSGNPFGNNDYYMTIFTGNIQVPNDGLYEFAVDGDDAVEVTINDGLTDRVVGWYGPHGRNNSEANLNTYSMSVLLTAGINYSIKFRMEQATGGASYYLYWKEPVPASGITDYIVRTQVCTTVDRDISHETNSCEPYPNGNYKPVGLLHNFGEDDTMLFGLLSGSYENNLDGGVLRKAVSSFKDEVDLTTGRFDTSTNGIVSTLDKLRVMNYDDSRYRYACGWITNRPITNGECDMWGNPVAEMMYESLRYFSGKGSPTADFNIASSGNNDAALGLPLATWSDPYDATTGYDECAKPFQIVVSDINPSYDSDKVPGAHSSFGSTFSGDITGLNASALADTITAGEGNIKGNSFFIGQSDTNYDNAPTAKVVQSLGSIRGMAPEEPTKLGSYYAASMAYYGLINDINPRAGDQKLQTFSVALASPLPTIEIDPDNNILTTNSVVIVPFAKSPGQSSMWPNFQPTNQIVDFYVESLGSTSGSFLVNYEDVEQGADHDMDAIARYTYAVNANGTVTIDVDSIYAAGGIDQHMGYVISGTQNRDGVYLEVKDRGGRDHIYPLDTPPGVWAGDSRGSDLLGYSASRTFTPSGAGASASFLKDPLWYAAKWGGFIESGTPNDQPDLTTEWDSDSDGTPDNYFMVTNALTLKDQMEDAFDEVLARSGAATTVAVSSGSIRTDTLLYQALFNTNKWTGSVRAIDFSPGSNFAINWELSEKLRSKLALSGGHDSNREVITMNDAGTGVPFRFPADYSSPTASEMSSGQVSDLLSGISSDQQNYGVDLVNFLRGDGTEEKGVTGATRSFRDRGDSADRNVLGDIVHSDPLHVVAPNFFYPDVWPITLDGNPATSYENAAAQKYSDYRTLMKTRQPVLYVGANDGMLHAINAYKNGGGVTDGGEELLAYVPNILFDKLPDLADQNYSHQYYVDGKTAYADVFFNSTTQWHTALVGTLHGGGQGVFALDISDPKGIASGSGYSRFDEGSASKIALWEFTDAEDADLGFTFGKPTIARLANGKWAAIFGNGYDNTEADGNVSTTGNSAVYIVDIETGALIKKFDTEIGILDDPTGLGQPNGMSEPIVTDTNRDFIADYIYAGDLFGNMWKIDISSVNAANWGFAFTQAGNPAPLYKAKSSAGDSLPITQAPVIVNHPKYGYRGDNLVFFGTGKYIENTDNVRLGEPTQSFFGIWDDGTNGKTRSSLLTQTITEVTATNLSRSVNRLVSDNKIYWDDVTNSTGTITQSKHGGWLIDLVDSSTAPLDNKGERSISKAVFQNSRLIFTTYSPTDDPCKDGGSGWVMIVDAEDGSGPDSSIDFNGDNKFNNDDMIDTDGDGTGDTASAGFKVDGGVTSSVVVIDDNTNGSARILINETSAGGGNGGNGGGNTLSGLGVGGAGVSLNPLLSKRLYWRELK